MSDLQSVHGSNGLIFVAWCAKQSIPACSILLFCAQKTDPEKNLSGSKIIH